MPSFDEYSVRHLNIWEDFFEGRINYPEYLNRLDELDDEYDRAAREPSYPC